MSDGNICAFVRPTWSVPEVVKIIFQSNTLSHLLTTANEFSSFCTSGPSSRRVEPSLPSRDISRRRLVLFPAIGTKSKKSDEENFGRSFFGYPVVPQTISVHTFSMGKFSVTI